MTEPRKSTVYDYSDLRLHPDGRRVYQKSTNLRPKLAQCTVQDSRSNWIAADAGGSGKVPLFRRKKRSGNLEDEEEKDMDVGGSGPADDDENSTDDDADKKGKRRSKRPDYRTVKRVKFLKNDDYLIGANSTPNLADSSDVNSVLPLPYPSPDLLKCIHRFASKFYSERGQLLNSSRQYRKERKERRNKRAVDRRDSSSSLGSTPSSLSSSSGELQSQSAEKVNEELDYSKEDLSEGSTVGTKRRKTRRRRKGRHRSEKLYVDMYKVFDGSAMMALGMLVQEHIAHLLNPSVPESWEKEIRTAYRDQDDDDDKDSKEARRDSSEDDDKESQKRVVNEQKIASSSRSANKEGGQIRRSQLEVQLKNDDDDGTSEKEGNLTYDDESSRSEDTDHPSSSEAEYR